MCDARPTLLVTVIAAAILVHAPPVRSLTPAAPDPAARLLAILGDLDHLAERAFDPTADLPAVSGQARAAVAEFDRQFALVRQAPPGSQALAQVDADWTRYGAAVDTLFDQYQAPADRRAALDTIETMSPRLRQAIGAITPTKPDSGSTTAPAGGSAGSFVLFVTAAGLAVAGLLLAVRYRMRGIRGDRRRSA